MVEYPSTPIGSRDPEPAEVVDFLATIRSLSIRGRIGLGLLATLGGVASAFGSYVLLSEVHHWGAWLFSFLILDPAAILAFLLLALTIAPESSFSSLLGGPIRRVKLAGALLLLASVGLILGLFVFVGWEFWKLHR